ncbi:outer membrane beta-barrel family protein [Riemerella columbina]|uniref:outer membrane beta-barrel family protein n=1 Tax=Riemerella columbina TaxID=103810 RepID=UPI00266E94B6|nr:outer membrane beta-barrel family protein [Riemerella columbina]WKS95502.1 outer membrane beta-barrel family protein [Riemerella columbina]
MILRISTLCFFIFALGRAQQKDSIIKTDSIAQVVFTKKSPVLKRKIDRLEFKVENSNLSALNAWEILKKTPSVSILGQSIRIKGSTSHIITINDKKVTMSDDELQTFLENIQGDDLKAIEIITNPPARYEASGTTVINFKIKTVTSLGYRGRLNAQYTQATYGRGNFGGYQQWKNKQWTLQSGYQFSAGHYYRENLDVVHYTENNETWESVMNRKETNAGQHSFFLNTDYAKDSLTSFSLNYRYLTSLRSYGVYDVPTSIYQNGQLASSYRTVNTHEKKYQSHNLSTQMEHQFKNGWRLSWLNYWSSKHSQPWSHIYTELNFKNQPPAETEFRTQDNARINLYATQIDTELKTGKWQIETGSKYSYITAHMQLDFWEKQQNDLQISADKSNDFKYHEHNFAAYISATHDWEQWQIKTGLRAEYTGINSWSMPQQRNHQNQYWSLFPTFYIQYTTAGNHQLGLSYGKRIERPPYQYLNPAKSYYNLFSYFQGDPNLKAMLAHQLSLTYTHKNWNVEAYYRKKTSPFMEIAFQIPASKMMVYRYMNIEKEQAAGIDLSKSWQVASFWDLNLYTSGEYVENHFFGLDQQIYLNKGFYVFAQMSHAFKLDRTTDWNLEVGGHYISGGIQGSFSFSPSANVYLLMSRKFRNKKTGNQPLL